MMSFFKRPRSAGIRVSRAVHRSITDGDRARGVGAWSNAIHAYTRAVSADPNLVHIWIQLGHALKEDGRRIEAEAAYREALARRPGDRDACLHIAHLLKAERELEAAEAYAILANDDPVARIEAVSIMTSLEDDARQRFGRRIGANSEGEVKACVRSHAGVIFDLSDLFHHLRQGRSPTGIQRVQWEIVLAVVRGDLSESGDLTFVIFLDGATCWLPVAPQTIVALAGQARSESMAGDSGRAVLDLVASVYGNARILFCSGDMLVNLGTAWTSRNYQLAIAAAKADARIIFTTMVFDVIPLLFPDWCDETLTDDFRSWFAGAVRYADGFVAISQSTKRDLLDRAEAEGVAIERERVAVVPLDACSPALAAAANRVPNLASPSLHGQPFVLLVSTIEPRKGHLDAFEAWSRLIALYGADAVPVLVCAGRNGWRTDAIFARLTQDAPLAAKVVMLPLVSDDALATLYADCLFTIYPSKYEGWGLPITESLCAGRIVVTADHSSLREAGGDLAIYTRGPGAEPLVEAVTPLITDYLRRRELEAEISSRFQSRSWGDVGRQLITEVRLLHKLGARADADLTAHAAPGRHYSMAWRAGSGPRAPGAAYRIGLGWFSPGEEGTRTRAGGGELRVGVPAAAGSRGATVELELKLIGSHRVATDVEVTDGAGSSACFTLPRGDERRIRVFAAINAQGEANLKIEGWCLSPSAVRRSCPVMLEEFMLVEPAGAAGRNRSGQAG